MIRQNDRMDQEGREKMKRLSRLTALLLALVLVLSMSVGAWAEEKKEDISREEYEAALAAAMANFPNLTPEEQYSFLISLNGSDEMIASYLALLNEDQMMALSAYIAEVDGYEAPKTVVFTDAGPFLPAVYVGRARALNAARYVLENSDVDNGLELRKSATYNEEDGTYTITMEAWTTGTVTSSTKTVPVDIVLVLDQSGSMAYDFNGNSTNTNTARRQYAMKQAVNNFIASVKEKYTDDADHRMAIVTFGSTASTLQGWTFVDDAGKNTLQGKINDLPESPSGATNVAAGMKQAETLMGSGYRYTGTNTTRQKVVVVFTDGVPTTNTDFDTTVATGAISSAKNLKDDGATVYTVGIFNGANPNELYGASGFDTNSNGTIGSQWIKDTWGLFPGTDFPEADRPAGNRFLNYLSSNFPEAESIGLTRETEGWGILHYKITYKITNNFTRSASNYYLTANDSSSLNTIFQTISNNIQTANIDLGSDTVVKDVVTPYFSMPSDVSKISIYTADYDGSAFKAREINNGISKTVNSANRTVSVTGFDFNANFVSDTPKDGGTYGKKLIIEFTVTPTEDFLGGNYVPTNAETSAVYDKDGTKVEEFPVPTVDVPVKTVSPVVQDQNIYLTNPADLTQLVKNLGQFTVGEGETAPVYSVDGTNNAFVGITYTIKDGNTVIATYTIPAGTETSGLSGIVWIPADGKSVNPQLDADKDYTIVCTVTPKTVKDSNPAQSDSETANVKVFKPEMTFKDSVVDYLSIHNFPGYYEQAGKGQNRVSDVWMHGSEEADATKMGNAPELTLVYTADSADITGLANGVGNGTIAADHDIPVNVAVSVNTPNPSVSDSTSWDITKDTTFVHSRCGFTGCTWDEEWNQHDGSANKDDTSGESIPEFLIHVENIVADLTITKTGLNKNVYPDGDNESAIVTVECTDSDKDSRTWTVVLTKKDNWRATLSGLKVGATYIVTEQTGWTWRYTSTNPTNTVTIVKEGSSVTIENTQTNPYWLGGDNYCVNEFASEQATTD